MEVHPSGIIEPENAAGTLRSEAAHGEVIMTRLPRVYQTMLELQMLDITTDPIETAPTAHYSMGGGWVAVSGIEDGTSLRAD